MTIKVTRSQKIWFPNVEKSNWGKPPSDASTALDAAVVVDDAISFSVLRETNRMNAPCVHPALRFLRRVLKPQTSTAKQRGMRKYPMLPQTRYR